MRQGTLLTAGEAEVLNDVIALLETSLAAIKTAIADREDARRRSSSAVDAAVAAAQSGGGRSGQDVHGRGHRRRRKR